MCITILLLLLCTFTCVVYTSEPSFEHPHTLIVNVFYNVWNVFSVVTPSNELLVIRLVFKPNPKIVQRLTCVTVFRHLNVLDLLKYI